MSGRTPDRIRSMRYVTAMVALDTIDLIAERVINLVRHGRHIAMTRRYTYLPQAPDLTVGLLLDGEPKVWRQAGGGKGLGIHLKPGLNGFGFSAYPGEADTETDVWQRYHADPDNRRDMTEVIVTGGLPGDGPARDDQLTICHWNQYGVCEERVIGFDYRTGRGSES